jgi:hypothetical protein
MLQEHAATSMESAEAFHMTPKFRIARRELRAPNRDNSSKHQRDSSMAGFND